MKNIHILGRIKPKIAFIALTFMFINFPFLAGCSNGQKEVEKGFAYISSQKGNVLVMSLENSEIISEIEVGSGNRGIGITEDGSKLVVAVKSTNDLAVVDLKTNKVSKRIFIGKNPEMVRVRNGKAFVTFEPAAIVVSGAVPGALSFSSIWIVASLFWPIPRLDNLCLSLQFSIAKVREHRM